MKWDLEFGPRIDQLRALREAGKEVPALERRPILPESLIWAWEGYADLNRGRNWSMGAPLNISIMEIMAYGELKGLGREEVEELLGFVRLLDEIYFEDINRKQKAKAKSGRVRSQHRRARGSKG